MFKPVLSIIFTFLSCGGAFAAQKIVTFDAAMSPEAQARLIESRGGRVVKEFAFINAVLADFPDSKMAADISRAPGVAAAEDDEEIYWLGSEETSFAEAAALSARDIRDGVPQPVQPPAVSTPPAPVAPVYISTVSVEGKIDRMPWGVGKMLVPQVWARTKGKGARVAVLDTGADCAHPDLAPNCTFGYNTLNPGAVPFDDGGHGTHVAGIIAGALNWNGMVGVAPEATILPVKVLNSSGTGKVSQIIDGLGWAVQQRVDIINMSLGAPKYSDAQSKAVKAAREAGILVVSAAGNDAGPVNYPAAYEDSLAVASMDFSNKIAGSSSRGPEIDFIAPGVKIFSSYPGGKFMVMSGTSQAAPHISGLAALAVGLGVKGPDALRAALTKASYNVGLPPQEQGAGLPVAFYMVKNILAAQK
ncbi:MAG: S8 family peptidase [Elusimicrobiales bacterium]|nr:S8 family peptidase [Elusimicrobiales bacterium]